ncbi:MAG: tetratricopeptide repeat protein [Bacteroidia bacterium]|nr:tetratricopeptide repeat protein [Bacteroidia bacterium]
MSIRIHIILSLLFLLSSAYSFGQNSLSFIKLALDENNISLAEKSIDAYFHEHSGKEGRDAWILKGDIYARKGILELEDRLMEAQTSFRKAKHAYKKAKDSESFQGSSSINAVGEDFYETKQTHLYNGILSEANGFYLQNELDWTIRASKWAMALNPEKRKAYEMSINTSLEIKDYVRALKCIEAACLQFPDDADFRESKKNCLSKMVNEDAGEGQWEKVKVNLLKLIEIEPRNGDFRFNLAMAYNQLGKPDEAIEQLVVSTRLNPDDYLSYYFLAKIQYNKAMALQAGKEQKKLLENASLYLQIGHHIHPRQAAINDLLAEIKSLLSKG